MAIDALCVEGYRSVRHVYLPLKRVNVIVGANATGKTNLYRALNILHRAAAGSLARAMAEEGGMPSILWAGARREGAVRMCIAARTGDFSYHLECGLPTPQSSLFSLDPEVKEERIFLHRGGKKVQLLGRKKEGVWARDDQGKRVEYGAGISPSESVLGEIREPQRFPEIFLLRRELLSWRFYHQFRTDAESPIRQPQVGTLTPVLSHDGKDLAAAIQTILEVGEGEMFRELLREAFPGAQVEVDVPPQTVRFAVRMQFPGFARWFEAGEVSDGTIQYLCLLAALLSPRPPELIALNEPEASIHADLLGALGRLIVKASARTQLWITTHSMQLAETVRGEAECHLVQLEKVDEETRVFGQSELERAMEV